MPFETTWFYLNPGLAIEVVIALDWEEFQRLEDLSDVFRFK